jgi:hypothetical protein
MLSGRDYLFWAGRRKIIPLIPGKSADWAAVKTSGAAGLKHPPRYSLSPALINAIKRHHFFWKSTSPLLIFF